MGIIELFLLALTIVFSPVIALCAIITLVIILIFILVLVFVIWKLCKMLFSRFIGLFRRNGSNRGKDITA